MGGLLRYFLCKFKIGQLYISMRHSLQLNDTNKNKRLEEKLIFLEGTAGELIGENHKLKEDLIMSKKRYEAVFEELIKEIQIVEETQKVKQQYASQIEQFKSIVRNLIASMKELKLKLAFQIDQNVQRSLAISSLNATIQSLNKQLSSSREELAQHLSHNEFMLDRKTTQLKAQIQTKSASVNKLASQLQLVKQQILELHNSYNSENQILRKQIAEMKQQHKVEVWQVNDSYTKQMRKLRSQYQAETKAAMEKYLGIIEMKKQQNEALIKVIRNKGLMVQPELEGLRMIEFRENLVQQLEQSKQKIKELKDQIDNLKDKINEGNKKYLDLSNSNSKKIQQMEKFKVFIRNMEKSLENYRQQNDKLKAQIQNSKKYKVEQDKVQSNLWQRQLQKIAMNYQIQQRREIQQVKITLEKQMKDKQMVFECQILNLKEREQQLIEIARKLEQLNQILTKDNKLYQQIISIKDAKILQLNSEIMRSQTDRQNTIQQFLTNIEVLKNEIAIKMSLIKNLQDEINKLQQTITNQKEIFDKQKEQMVNNYKIELQQQKVENKKRQQQALNKLYKDLSMQFGLKSAQQAAKYQTQIQSVKQSCHRSNNNLLQEKNLLEKRYLQTIEILKKDQKQLKWILESKLRQQKNLRKQDAEKLHHQIYTLKLQLGKQGRQISQLSQKISDLQKQLNRCTQVKDSLLDDVVSFKKIITAEKESSDKLKNLIKQKQTQIQNLHQKISEVKVQYNNVKGQIMSIRADFSNQMKKQQQRHSKIVIFYRNRIKQLQAYVVNKASQIQYIQQIQELKAQNQSLDTSLIKCQAELIKFRGLSLYHQTQAQNLKQKMKNERKSVAESSRVEIQPKTKRRTFTSRQENSGSVSVLGQYQRFSTSRKKKCRQKVLQYSSIQSGIANYSLVNSLRQTFRLKTSKPTDGHIRSSTEVDL